MTTETQPQAQQELQDGENINVWRVIGGIEANQQAMLQRFDQQDARMDGLESRMDRLESRMDGLESRMDRLEARMDRLESRMDRLLYAMVALTIFNAGTIVALIAN